MSQDTLQRHLAAIPPYLSLNGNKGPRLFHYTTYPGLVGIMTSKQLWATNIRYLNDIEEFKHGLDVVGRQARKLAKDGSAEQNQLLSDIAGAVEQYGRVNIFVSSFSEKSDVLSQWRGYAAGGGVSLSFDFEHLRTISQRGALLLVKCIYDDAIKAQFANEMLLDTLTRFNGMNDISEPVTSHVVLTFLANFLPIAACFKHRAFSEEAEWRIVSRPVSATDTRIDFRSTPKMITPYIKIELENGINSLQRTEIGIDEVMIGPTAEKDLLMDSVSNVILNRSIGVKSICHSAAPYREI